MIEHVGFGGGCHWCTEAVFEALRGVTRVDQGWLAPLEDIDAFSEGVVVAFDDTQIELPTLVAVHLHTHSCTSSHALRSRYRSAIYALAADQAQRANAAIARLQTTDFDRPIITQVYRFGAFRGNQARYLHYAQRHPDQPFCERFIDPKLALLRERFATHTRPALVEPARPGACRPSD